MKNIRFTGVMPALLTPLHADGSVNTAAVKPLTDFALDNGVDGFYVCGSSGEGPVLSASARMEMTEAVMDAVKSRKTRAGRSPDVIVHVAAPNPLDAMMLARHAEKLGADAVSSLSPNFVYEYNEEELLEYYRVLAGQSSLPLLIYAKPSLKAADIKGFIEKAMEIETVIGLKFTIRDYFHLRRIKEINGGDVNVINGPDETLLCGLTMGADGGIGTTYNLMPDWFAALYDCWKRGDLAAAQAWQYKINRVIDVVLRFGKNGAINASKAVLRLKGFDVGNAVFPNREYSVEEMNRLAAELRAVDYEI